MTQRQSQGKLLSISEFAKASSTTPRALRLWQKHGLLRPYRQDKWTHYRYYHLDQVDQVLAIKWWQELGVKLKDIPLQRKQESEFKTRIEKLDQELAFLRAKKQFLLSLHKFLKRKKPALKKVWIGDWQLLTHRIKRGSYARINDYVQQTWRVARRCGATFAPVELTFYETPRFDPLASDLKIGLIIKKGKVSRRLPAGFQLEYYARRHAYEFEFLGPYRFLTMFFRKIDWYFVKHNIPVYLPVFEMYIRGPFNTSIDYNYLTKIYYPIP